MKHDGLNMIRTSQLTQEQTITATRNTPYLSLKNYRSVIFTFYGDIGRANAADDTTITLRQAKTGSGGSAKAFTPRRAYLREGSTIDAAIQDTPTEVSGGSMVTNGNMHSILDVEVDASELDLANDFAFVRASTAAVGSATRTASFHAVSYGPRHMTDPRHLANPRT